MLRDSQLTEDEKKIFDIALEQARGHGRDTLESDLTVLLREELYTDKEMFQEAICELEEGDLNRLHHFNEYSKYAELGNLVSEAVSNYADEVAAERAEFIVDTMATEYEQDELNHQNALAAYDEQSEARGLG